MPAAPREQEITLTMNQGFDSPSCHWHRVSAAGRVPLVPGSWLQCQWGDRATTPEQEGLQTSLLWPGHTTMYQLQLQPQHELRWRKAGSELLPLAPPGPAAGHMPVLTEIGLKTQ